MLSTRPVRCEKCGTKYTRTHGRQRFCTSCIPNWRRTRGAVRQANRLDSAVAVQAEPKPAQEPFTYEDLCRVWAKRTGKQMAWLERTGNPVREYPDFRELTAREVSVAIGWVPWPASWPGRRQRKAVA
jgi:hypothetical protein